MLTKMILGLSRFYRWPRPAVAGAPRPATPGLVLADDSSPPLVEAFRLLALNIRALLLEGLPQTVLVMSAFPQDGRSLVAANLAAALTELSPRVLLIDGNGQNPGLPDLLPVNEDSGAKGTLPEDVSEELAIASQPTCVSGLWVMPYKSRDVIADGVAHAPTASMIMVIDTPPCVTSSDPYFLAPLVGGVLYVVRNRPQEADQHRLVRAQLNRLGARLLGIVLNEG